MKNNKKYPCPHCDKEYSKIGFMLRHLKQKHPAQTNTFNEYIKEEQKLKLYIKQSSKKHNNKYDYTKVVLMGRVDDKITIVCKEHGDFIQRAYLHKSQGNGCPQCSVVRVSKKNCLSKEKVVSDFKKVHGDRYDYSKVIFEKVDKEVKIICKECETVFEQRPRHHKRGNGCPKCADYGFDNTSKAILYYLRVVTDKGVLYKIGISNNTLEMRYGKQLELCEIIKIEHYEKGIDARNKEKEIIKMYKGYKYKGPKIFRRGNTELFTHDVLGLDPLSKHTAKTTSTPPTNDAQPLQISTTKSNTKEV